MNQLKVAKELNSSIWANFGTGFLEIRSISRARGWLSAENIAVYQFPRNEAMRTRRERERQVRGTSRTDLAGRLSTR
jgi:hypothetical protein